MVKLFSCAVEKQVPAIKEIIESSMKIATDAMDQLESKDEAIQAMIQLEKSGHKTVSR
jgi:hypothetical protein